MKLFYLPVLVVVVMASALPVAYAQTITRINVEERGDYVLGPGKTEIFIDPGSGTTKNLHITNRSPERTTFQVTVEDLVGSESEEQPVVLLGEEAIGPYSLKNFISLPITEFTLDFGERATFPVSVNIPEGTEPGGYYGAIIVSNAPSKGEEVTEGAGATIVSRLASLFLVRVNGDVEESGKLEDFRILGGRNVFWSNDPLTFEVLFRNDGNVHLTPYGEIEVKNLFGNAAALLPVNAYFALPQSLRYREVAWDPGLLIGRYTATVTINRGYDDLEDTLTLSFWVFPWKIILAALAAIVLVSAIVYFAFTRFEIRRK